MLSENIQIDQESYSIDDFQKMLEQKKIENSILTFDSDQIQRRYLVFKFPVARSFDEIVVFDGDRNLNTIVSSVFYKYRGITNYEAIWSQELKLIECEVQFNNGSTRMLLEFLSHFFNDEEPEDAQPEQHNRTRIVLFESDLLKVSIGSPSKEFAFISLYKDGRRGISLDGDLSRFRTTLLIEGLSCKTEDNARKNLEKISNSLFYQIDVLANRVVYLASRRESRDERFKRMARNNRNAPEKRELRLDYEYDEIPMSLYWFAKTSNHSPIFQYFALYQALEYYYPIYAADSVKNRIQNLVKDLAFNINKDTDVLRLLNILQSNNPNGYGDEREQLDVTLRRITNGSEIVSYLSERVHLQEYYQSKDAAKLSGAKLRTSDSTGIMDDVAKRIYDIRCRIVHNKASESEKKILPMTREAGYLSYEVELLQFIVRKALVANSRPFAH